MSGHEDICEAFFQEPEALEKWSNSLPLAPIMILVGDGHPGGWKVAESFAAQQGLIQRQVLDWYHLVENLHKVGGSIKRLKAVENLLWHGFVEAAVREFDGLKNKRVQKLRDYLSKHRGRIPDYERYQRLGIPIGSGDVESGIKQVGARVKLPGACWLPQNVHRILRLRCAYLNCSPFIGQKALTQLGFTH